MNTKILKPITTVIAILLVAGGVTSQEAEIMYVLKNSKVTHEIAVSSIDSIIFYNPNNPNPLEPTVDEGVIINGVKWATRNVAAPGRFATDPEDAGMLYQWNRKKAWSPAGYVIGWDDTLPVGNAWEKINDPSPEGWHVPAYEDVEKLFDADKVSSEWTVVNGVGGRRFIDRASGNSIFLPAIPSRGDTAGSLFGNEGISFGYWSNRTFQDSDLYAYYFSSSSNPLSLLFPLAATRRGLGFGVRPVAD